MASQASLTALLTLPPRGREKSNRVAGNHICFCAVSGSCASARAAHQRLSLRRQASWSAEERQQCVRAQLPQVSSQALWHLQEHGPVRKVAPVRFDRTTGTFRQSTQQAAGYLRRARATEVRAPENSIFSVEVGFGASTFAGKSITRRSSSEHCSLYTNLPLLSSTRSCFLPLTVTRAVSTLTSRSWVEGSIPRSPSP